MLYATETEIWGSTDNQTVYRYLLRNKNNVSVLITNFGATITAINVPDNSDHITDVALGYDNLQGYINDPYYMGGIVGRYANRIAGGLVKIDDAYYQLSVKPGGYHHHGGEVGFNKKAWQSAVVDNEGFPAVKMEYLSPDGEEGFPGNLQVTVMYTLTDKNELIVDLTAVTDKTTLLNLTQHTYFNLAGHNAANISEHELMMPLSSYLPVTDIQVPIGELKTVTRSPFDFTLSKKIGKDINSDHEQMKLGAGYDHTWVIKEKYSDELRLTAQVAEPESGRQLKVYTTEPSVHFYTGNYLNGTVPGKNGFKYPYRSGFCLETQHYPDSPNHSHFPETILRKGEVFNSRTIFEFNTLS